MNKRARYRIRVQGHLGALAASRFEGFEIERQLSGETFLIARMDQSALHGALGRVRDLGIPLIGVDRQADQDIDEA